MHKIGNTKIALAQSMSSCITDEFFIRLTNSFQAEVQWDQFYFGFKAILEDKLAQQEG